MFRPRFVDNKLSIVYMKRAGIIQKIQEAQPLKSSRAQVASRPSAFEMQVSFHGLMFLEECMEMKLMCTVHNYNNDMRLRYAVRVMMKVWNACIPAAELESTPAALQPSTFYNNHTTMFQGIGSRCRRLWSTVSANARLRKLWSCAAGESRDGATAQEPLTAAKW